MINEKIKCIILLSILCNVLVVFTCCDIDNQVDVNNIHSQHYTSVTMGHNPPTSDAIIGFNPNDWLLQLCNTTISEHTIEVNK